MKKVLKLLILLLIIALPSVFAESSRFTPKASLQSEEIDKNNYFYVVLSYKGELVNQVEEEVTYNGRFLEFIDAQALNGYSIDSGNLIKDGRYRKIKISSKFDTDYESTEYCVLTFRILNTFKIKKNTFIEIKDYKAYSSDGISKYKYDGIEVSINRETLNKVTLSYGNLNSTSKIRNIISEYLYKFFMVCAIILIIVLLIVLLPTKREILRTNREREASKKVNSIFFSRDDYRMNIDDIKMIGEKPKEEPKNKLELGNFDPFKDNVAKRDDVSFDSSKDFKAVDASVFNNTTPNNLNAKTVEEPVEELIDDKKETKKSTKKEKAKPTKAKKEKKKNVKEGKDGLIMISSNKIDDANKDDLD